MIMRFFIKTFGCQMNENDSERMGGLLHSLGWEKTDEERKANLIIVNTCAVREKSEDKLFSYLGRLKNYKRKNNTIIGVTGCVAQLEKDKIFERAPHVDFILGPHNYHKINEIIRNILDKREKLVDTQWQKEWPELSEKHVLRESQAIAYVTIMEGCNNFCAYCIVPFTRGREKYRPFWSIIKEVEQLAQQGYKEVQLLGQNVNSYFDVQEGKSFVDLLKEVNKVNGIEWIRFITSHPKNFTKDIAHTMKDLEKVCPQLHLPVQAGSTSVLQRMRRGYTREEYLEKVNYLKKLIPDISLSTDIIVGFPGETREEFEETLSLLKEVEFDNIFSFRYSERPYTLASRMDDNVPYEEKINRLIELQRLQKEIQIKNNKKKIGKIFKVLVTGKSKKDKNMWTGRNIYNQVVNFKGNDLKIGKFVNVLITDIGPYSLRGKQVK
jgi:tRNA-2-methylthio-N6-dimethylallyladenosine synthase